MHRLLVDGESLKSDSPTLSKEAANHLKVVRPKDGEEIELFDGKGNWRVFKVGVGSGSGSGSGSGRADFSLTASSSIFNLQPSTFVLIGDSIHDKEVAEALGVRCVLFSGGSHSRARLLPLAPVGDTLEECVELALNGGRS